MFRPISLNRCWKGLVLLLALALQLISYSEAFVFHKKRHTNNFFSRFPMFAAADDAKISFNRKYLYNSVRRHCAYKSLSSGSSSEIDGGRSSARSESSSSSSADVNRVYVQGLTENLMALLDKWILTGSPESKQQAYNVLEQIQRLSQDSDLVQKAERLVSRAGLPVKDRKPKQGDDNNKNKKRILGHSDDNLRRKEADERQRWERSRQEPSEAPSSSTASTGRNVRSALSQRASSTSNRPDVLLGQIDPRLESTAKDKAYLEKEMNGQAGESENTNVSVNLDAASRVSEYIAKAGGGSAFDPDKMGIGGLDDVLAQVKRRIWIPLAAPPQLLKELGINPVRGLLLYGKPGCGKTLLARSLGKILSPLRPITIVSGPEILDKFVGSSEKNLREIFDNPPDIFDSYRIGERDAGTAIASAALHVIVMDEFDAIARTRGGRGGTGDQGDAGVARDSVVNQLLAKMDGVDPLIVPTLVIGLTNKRSLVEPALLRPGRFEVQIEVPPPRTAQQRMSILKVHTNDMHRAGRLLVSDAPPESSAARLIKQNQLSNLPSYEQLLKKLAEKCDGFSGASLAGVARAAASHALERAVEDFSEHISEDRSLLRECVVTTEDFDSAVNDILKSVGDSDWSEDDEQDQADQDSVDSPPDSESSDSDV